MDRGTQQKWRDGIGNLLDLSAWHDPSNGVDLLVEDNDKLEIEIIELDTDAHHRPQQTKCNVTGSMGRNLDQLA